MYFSRLVFAFALEPEERFMSLPMRKANGRVQRQRGDWQTAEIILFAVGISPPGSERLKSFFNLRVCLSANAQKAQKPLIFKPSTLCKHGKTLNYHRVELTGEEKLRAGQTRTKGSKRKGGEGD